MKRYGMLVVGLVCVAMFAAGCGCSKKEEKVGILEKAISKAVVKAASGGKASLDVEGDEIVIKDKDGKSMRASWKGEVPADFPKDVPLYKGAEVVHSMSSPEASTLSLKTADPVKTVSAFYEKELSSGGWTQATTMNMQGNMMLAYEKDGRNVTVMISNTGEERVINLAVAAARGK